MLTSDFINAAVFRYALLARGFAPTPLEGYWGTPPDPVRTGDIAYRCSGTWLTLSVGGSDRRSDALEGMHPDV